MRFLYLLLCFLCLCTRSSRAEEIWYLRIIARDDTPAAQAEKIALRDHLLPLFPENSKDLPSALPGIIRSARQFAACHVEIRKWAPHQKTPPAPTVYITLGEGSGHNWWGLLYRDSYRLLPSSQEISGQADQPIRFSWPVLHWLKSLFHAS